MGILTQGDEDKRQFTQVFWDCPYPSLFFVIATISIEPEYLQDDVKNSETMCL